MLFWGLFLGLSPPSQDSRGDCWAGGQPKASYQDMTFIILGLQIPLNTSGTFSNIIVFHGWNVILLSHGNLISKRNNGITLPQNQQFAPEKRPFPKVKKFSNRPCSGAKM